MTLKRYQKAIIITVSILVAVVAAGIGILFALDSLSYDHDDVDRLDIVKIAKEEHGCDKVIWFQRCANDSLLIPDGVSLMSRYVYCVIAEKDGEEVFLIIPSDYNKEKGFFAEWKFDYSFAEIIAKMESVGVVVKPHGNGIDNAMYDDIGAFDITLDGASEEICNRFDVNIYIVYYSNYNLDYNYACFVMQENHELRIYRQDDNSLEYTLLC